MKSCPICLTKSVKYLTIINNYPFIRCFKCSFVFVYPRPTINQLNSFYRNFDYKDSDLVEKRIRSDSNISINFIKRYIKEDDNIMDIGCGRGYFLDELRKKGYKNIEGIDFSSNVVKYAIGHLKLKVKIGDFNNFSKNNFYNLVLLNQVIEHILDINILLTKTNNLLQKGGYIYISTPNINSASAFVFKGDFEHFIPPEHINYFNIKSLSSLLNKHGYKIIKYNTWGYPENIAGIIKKILKIKSKNNKDLENTYVQANQRNEINNIKYLLFDKMFCTFSNKFIDLLNLGINLQVLAQKI